MNIYISHPFGNKQENKTDVERIIKKLVKEYPKHTFISPIHTFCFLYEEVDYDTGIKMCLELLKLCDVMWVYGGMSKGVKAEIEWCQANNKPFFIIKEE